MTGALAYHIIADPAPVLVLLPTESEALEAGGPVYGRQCVGAVRLFALRTDAGEALLESSL